MQDKWSKLEWLIWQKTVIKEEYGGVKNGSSGSGTANKK